MSSLSVEFIRMCWMILRMGCRSFAEGAFVYLLINTDLSIRKNVGSLNKNKFFLFSLVSSLITTLFGGFLCDWLDFRLLGSAVLVFFYFWNKQQKVNRNLANNCNSVQRIKYTLTTTVILILAVVSSDSISHMLLHTYCVSTGIYDIINSNWILRDLYRSSIMILDVFFIFLVYKFRFIKMKDIKATSMNKWVPISFSFCLISSLYLRSNYAAIPAFVQHRNAFLWTLAFVLPTYWCFYLAIKNQVKLLNLNANVTAYENILIWICNPSIIKTTHLDIYDSDVFMANFESKKLVLKQKLKKLGIDNKFKGYSELVLCLFLTRLFIGFKNWNFERDIFDQVSLVTDVPLRALRKDIENIIEYVWFTSESQDLIDGYYFPYQGRYTYDQTQRPTVEQFLTDIAKSI